MRRILRRPEEFVKTFTRKLLTYGVGRGLEATDEPIVRRIVSQAARDGLPVFVDHRRHRDQRAVPDEGEESRR